MERFFNNTRQRKIFFLPASSPNANLELDLSQYQ
jgi:hypothetical protein